MKIESGDSFTSSQPVETKQAQKFEQAPETSTEQIKSESILSNEQIKTKEKEGAKLPVSEKFIIAAIEKANKAIEGANTEMRFSVHERTHQISIKVIDKDKNEVIREIPPEKILDMVANMMELAGIFLDENLTPRQIINICEDQGRLFSYRGMFICAARSIYENTDCVRMLFVLKESSQGKIQDVEKIMDLLTELETSLVYLDKCKQEKIDNLLYVDIIKKLIPQE